VVGVVHDVISGQTYSAIRDRGALGPGGELWRPPYRATVSGGVLAWLQGYGVTRTDGHARALRLTLERGCRRLVQLWAPLLCWVMLARGDIEGFVGYRAGFVDLPAGSLIAREAGVQIVDFAGAPLDERRQLDGNVDFVAGPAGALPELVVMVKAADEVTVTGLTE
jgi:myo-inositol-1(or 4)-monophosphatase